MTRDFHESPRPAGWPPAPEAPVRPEGGRDGLPTPAPISRLPEFWAPPLRERIGLPLFLFILTGFTTLLAGALQRGVLPSDVLARPILLLRGFPFSATLLLILGAHELGHFFASRRWGVDASLPYFIPAPTLFGTFGAVIRIRGRIWNRKALFDVAAAGPLAGMAVALPATLAGLALSRVVPLDPSGASGGLGLGSSWLFEVAAWLAIGPEAQTGNVFLHPMAFAGWCGFLVTSLNLIPAGQLDGGHIVYAILARGHRTVSFLSGLVLLGLSYWWPGWLLWAAVAIILGYRHPPLLDEEEPLGRLRRMIGFGCIGLMVLTFTRIPIHL